MAYGTKLKHFVAVSDEADPDIKGAVSQVTRRILECWQIVTSKGWVSGFSYQDEATEDVRRFVRDNAGLGLGIGLGVGVLILGLVVLVVLLK